jgi:hypothetical protein
MTITPEEETRLLRIELAARNLVNNGWSGGGNLGYRSDPADPSRYHQSVRTETIYAPEWNDLKEALGFVVDREDEGFRPQRTYR